MSHKNKTARKNETATISIIGTNTDKDGREKEMMDISALFAAKPVATEPKNQSQNKKQNGGGSHQNKQEQSKKNNPKQDVKESQNNTKEMPVKQEQIKKPEEGEKISSSPDKSAENVIENKPVMEEKSEREEEISDKFSEDKPLKKTESMAALMAYMETGSVESYEAALEAQVQDASESENQTDEPANKSQNLPLDKDVFMPDEDKNQGDKNKKPTVGTKSKKLAETKISSLEDKTLTDLNKKLVSHVRKIRNSFDNLMDFIDEKYPDEMTVDEIFKVIISVESALRDNRSYAIYCSEKVKTALEKREISKEKDAKVSLENIFEDIFYSKITSEYAYFRLPELSTKRLFQNDVMERIADFSLRNYIQEQLNAYQRENPQRLWNEFTFIFIHYYDENNVSQCRDTDNYNIKTAIDAFLGLLVTDDKSDNSHIIQLTRPSKYEPFTELYVLRGHYMGDVILKYLPRLSK